MKKEKKAFNDLVRRAKLKGALITAIVILMAVIGQGCVTSGYGCKGRSTCQTRVR